MSVAVQLEGLMLGQAIREDTLVQRLREKGHSMKRWLMVSRFLMQSGQKYSLGHPRWRSVFAVQILFCNSNDRKNLHLRVPMVSRRPSHKLSCWSLRTVLGFCNLSADRWERDSLHNHTLRETPSLPSVRDTEFTLGKGHTAPLNFVKGPLPSRKCGNTDSATYWIVKIQNKK